MPSRRKRRHEPPANVVVKQEPPDDEPKQKESKRQKLGRTQASSVFVKKDNQRGSRRQDLAPVTISPPGAQDDGSLKMKFILSPKREPVNEDEEMEDSEPETTSARSSSRDSASKKNPSLKMKFSFKATPEEPVKGKGKSPKKQSSENLKDELHLHPKKRFRTFFEESASTEQKATTFSVKKKKFNKFDSDSGYSDAQSTAHGALKLRPVDPPIPEIIGDKKKEKKKKRKEKDKKKKFFKNKSDKNRFLNVHRSSDEGEHGWIEDKELIKPKEEPVDRTEYEVITPWVKPPSPEPPVHSQFEIPLKPIKLKKDKKKSKNKSKRKHGKKSKKLLHRPEKKKKDKESFTQEQIIKIQQRLLLQGLKSPSSGGEDLGELNFSSHGEDLISQLTASSGHFDPSSLLDELPIDEPVVKPLMAKSSEKRMDKNKLKDKKNNRKRKVPSAYQMWCKASRTSIHEKTPGLDFAAMSRMLGRLWTTLPEKEKTKWKHKQRAQLLRHKNVPALSRLKKHVAMKGVKSVKARAHQYKAPPPHTDPIDVAAHLKLLGDSLTNVGRSLITQAGDEAEVHGSISVLMDSMLSAIAPLLCLTSQVDELNVIPKKTQSSLLENIAYIMPGL